MDNMKKHNKIYNNEINNVMNNEKISYRRKYQLVNSNKNKNDEILINNNFPNKTNLLYSSKKPTTSSAIQRNKNQIEKQNQNKEFDKYININNNQKLNSAKKRYIFPIEKNNEITKQKKSKMLFKSMKIEENNQNNFFKLDTDMSVGDDKRKNDFNKYSTKYQYANNLNSLHKSIKHNNKSIEKDKNKKDKNESFKNEHAKNKVTKNVIILKRPQNNRYIFNENKENKENKMIYKKNIISQEKDLKKFINNDSEKIKIESDKFSKEFDLFIEAFKEKKNEFMKKINLNNKEFLNSNKNKNSINNYYNDYLKSGNNFIKKGKFFLNLFASEDIEKYRIKKEIKNFEIKSKKVPKKKLEIYKGNNFDIKSKNDKNEKKKFNNQVEKVNNFFINNSLKHAQTSNKHQSEKPENIIKTGADLKNIDNNSINQNIEIEEIKDEKIKLFGSKQSKTKIKEQKAKEQSNLIKKKFEVIQKIENCENKFEKKDERCITSFAILKNNRIVLTYKGGIIKFYQFYKNQNDIHLIELIRLEEDEYCFNYAIELQDDNIAACSEDGTVKIIQLFLDNKAKTQTEEASKEKYRIIQIIKEMNNDPIYIIKELQNQHLVLGCWKNILVYQKASKYELINKIKFGEYTFSILEISPNEIVATHSDSKTLTVHNFNNYKFNTIENIESNENTNIICKYKNNRDIVLVGFDKGINIVSIVNKILIKKIILNEIISSVCPIEMEVDLGLNKTKIWGVMLGAKRKVYHEKVNYAYSMLQIGFNLNENEQGEIDIENNKDIKYEFISRKDRIHYYDITNLQNVLWNKNKESLDIMDNKNEQWIFSSGNEDKLIKIWKFK